MCSRSDARGPVHGGLFAWLEDDSAAQSAGGEEVVRFCDSVERPGGGDAGCEPTRIDKGAQLGKPRRVGADPDVVDSGAAQWDRRGSG